MQPTFFSTPASVAGKLAGQPVGAQLRITGFALPGDVLQRLLETSFCPVILKQTSHAHRHA